MSCAEKTRPSPTSIRLTKELIETIDRLAESETRTRNEQIKVLLMKALDDIYKDQSKPTKTKGDL